MFLRFTIPAATRGGQVRESASVVWVVGFDNRARLASMRESELRWARVSFDGRERLCGNFTVIIISKIIEIIISPF